MKAFKAMRLAAFCLLTALAIPCFAEEPAHITVFREKSNGKSFVAETAQIVNAKQDYVKSGYYFQVFLDGTHAAKLHVGHFVTFDVPAGRHEIRTKRTERIILDLKPGERVYIRPGLHSTYKAVLQVPETIEQASCQTVTVYVGNQVLKPVNPKDIKFGQVMPETAFPACTTQAN